jgi:hypothetical protein
MRFDAVAMIFANVASGFPGGKHHVMPCHHSLAEALRTHVGAAGIAEDPA